MNAVRMRLRAELRQSWRAMVALMLITALFGGLVLASLAGARRTHSAVARLYARGWEPDGFVDVPPERFAAIEALPEVRDFIEGAYTFAGAAHADGTPVGDLGGISAQSLIRAAPSLKGIGPNHLIVAGRDPDFSRPDEVFLNETAARILHVGVGASFPLAGYAPDQLDALFGGAVLKPKLHFPVVHVTGVGRFITDLPLADTPPDVQWLGQGVMVLTPAWFAAYGSQVGNYPGLDVRFTHGVRDVGAFKRDLAALTNGAGRFFPGSDDQTATVQAQRATSVASFALLIFAIIAGVAFVFVVGQSLIRHIHLEAADFPALRALGFSRTQLMMLSLARSAWVVVAGALLSVPVAVALSPLTPIGLARKAEIHPGVSFDGSILVLVAICFVAALLLFVLVPAWRVARTAGSRSEFDRAPKIADGFARAGFSPSVVSGVRLALEPGRGRTAVPVRSTLAASALALVALVAAVVFGTSLQHVADVPELQGWTWTVAVGNPHSQDLAAAFIPKLESIPGVSAIAGDGMASATVDGKDIAAIGLHPVQGNIPIVALDGRTPSAPDEIALGGKDLKLLGKRIGDTVMLSADGAPKPVSLRIVGQSLISPWAANDQMELGAGAVLSLDTLRRVSSDAAENLFLVRASANAVTQIRAEFPTQVLGVLRPTDVQNLQGVSGFPLVLAALLILLALSTIAHTLVSSVRRRRRDLAVLKTLGFIRRQIRTTVAWQATTIVTLALAVGVPVGIVTGRWGWIVYARHSAIAPQPAVPVVLFAVLIPAGVAIANLIALMPARAAASTRPAEVLRSE